MNTESMAKVFFIVAIVVAIFVAVPLIIIWSLNTLFATGIEYTFWTWLAALLLGMMVGQSAARK